MNTINVEAKASLLTQPAKADRWYKEPWLLLVAGGPAIVVCASIFTGIVAMRGADNVVAEDYYKQGLMINKDIQRDAHARALGLEANVQLDVVTEKVILNLKGNSSLPDSLQISFASATEDKTSVNEIVRRLRLVQTEPGHYEASLRSGTGIASTTTKLIHVKIETTDWRLTGDWFDPSQKALQLKATQ